MLLFAEIFHLLNCCSGCVFLFPNVPLSMHLRIGQRLLQMAGSPRVLSCRASCPRCQGARWAWSQLMVQVTLSFLQVSAKAVAGRSASHQRGHHISQWSQVSFAEDSGQVRPTAATHSHPLQLRGASPAGMQSKGQCPAQPGKSRLGEQTGPLIAAQEGLMAPLSRTGARGWEFPTPVTPLRGLQLYLSAFPQCP